MSKAIEGAAMLASFAGLALIPGLGWSLEAMIGPSMWESLMVGLAAGGVSMEAGALAEALTSNRGQNITTRQAAALRQIVYGQQRVGGTAVYQSTSGAGGSSGKYVYNYVVPLASHEIDAYINVYLDGRQVYWKQTRNPHGFHGNIGCGTVSHPPVATAIVSGGAVTGITATGGSGFANVKPVDGYRVRISGGGGSGATAWAYNTGTVSAPIWTVTMASGGTEYTSVPDVDIQGAYTFGGTGAADQQDPTQPGYGIGYGIGPGGAHYNFSSIVYAEVRFGDQPLSDSMESLTANDSAWPYTASGAGCAYLYLNVGYNTTQFPGPPEIRVTINGKNDIYDPRTGLTGYSSNWALQVADAISDTSFGLGDPSVNQEQLIAAANVCDEMISTSQGPESNYQQHIHFDTSTAPGDILAMMMPAAAGRLSRVGGEWMIYPAYWQGPSFTFDESSLTDGIAWTPYRSYKDLINCVNGTYVAPNYPYGVTGNLYDANGWYYGETDNLWPFAWQPTSFPQYASDVLHGYASNAYLLADGGTVLPKELTLRGVISIVQAQRLAKIEVMRNRQQGSGVFPMNLAAWQMIPTSVMQFNFPAMDWTEKYLEIVKLQLVCEPAKGDNGEDGAMMITCLVNVQETAPEGYEWDIGEELTPYIVEAIPPSMPYTPAAPSGLTLASSSDAAVIGADGVTIPRVLASWTSPADNTVANVDLQYKLHSSSTWLDYGPVTVDVTQAYISGVVSGAVYDFRICSLRSGGVASAWVEVDNYTVSTVLSSISAASVGGLSALSVGHLGALTLLGSGSATATLGDAAQVGTGAAISVVGSGSDGTVMLVTGTGTLAAGTICTVTFPAALAAAPNGVCVPNGASIPGLSWSTSATQLTLSVSAALAPGTTFSVGYSLG